MKSLSRTLTGCEGMGSRNKSTLCAGYRGIQLTRYQSCQAAMQKPKEINGAFNESSIGSFLPIFGVGMTHSEMLQLERSTWCFLLPQACCQQLSTARNHTACAALPPNAHPCPFQCLASAVPGGKPT